MKKTKTSFSSLLNGLKKEISSLNSNIKKIYRRIIIKLNQSQILMIVPHNNKASRRINIKNYTIFITSSLLISLVIFALISVNEHEKNETKISKLALNSTDTKKIIRAFKIRTEYTEKNSRAFFTAIKEVSNNLNGFNQIEIHNTRNKKSQISVLATVSSNMNSSLLFIQGASRLFKHFNEAKKYIPTGWPVVGIGIVTSPYGKRRSPFTGGWELHPGIDIGWWPGTPIKATAGGRIEFAGYNHGYGLSVLIKHKYGFKTRYAHLQKLNVKRNENIKKGKIIGLMGTTGYSTGFHLHYEVIYQHRTTNPFPYMMENI